MQEANNIITFPKAPLSGTTRGMEKERKAIIAPSILAADFSNTGEAIKLVEETGAKWIHLDVMDGAFVPNISFGPKFIGDLREKSNLFFDTHLMIERPERYIKEFAAVGSDAITVHAEACLHLHRTIHQIKGEGKESGVSLVPSTPVSAIELVLEDLDLVLIMSVNPGFGGQSFIESARGKIKELDELRKKHNYTFKIAVDGGVSPKNAQSLIDLGTDVLIMGSAFFGSPNPKEIVTTFQGDA